MASPTSAQPRRQRQPVPRLVKVIAVLIAAFAVLVGITWLAGGLRAAPAEPTPTPPPGSLIDQGRFDLRVESARLTRAEVGVADDVQPVFVVRMRITNNDTETASVDDFFKGIRVKPEGGRYLGKFDDGDFALLLDGGKDSTNLYPRVPVRVDAQWPVPQGTNPRHVVVEAKKWEYTEESFTSGEEYWSVSDSSPVAARVTVPLRGGGS